MIPHKHWVFEHPYPLRRALILCCYLYLSIIKVKQADALGVLLHALVLK
jgi:hypothetical protein